MLKYSLDLRVLLYSFERESKTGMERLHIKGLGAKHALRPNVTSICSTLDDTNNLLHLA